MMRTALETPRLILRPFRQEDAGDVYEYARDPRVGPIAGWMPHASIEESREIIRTVFSRPDVFAMELRQSGKVIGSVGFVGNHPAGEDPMVPDDEVGYALSPDQWGRGLMPEAVEAVLEYGFTQLGLRRIWCGHYAGNWRSSRVIGKCGFHYRFSRTEYVSLVNETRQSYFYVQTEEDWRERVSGAL
ncbi:MAG: GNAT family N-acetyltransferase [Dysosmobacter sp.]|nr:GNAT family N-acetyltransferase [Dysosmobacter sp.]